MIKHHCHNEQTLVYGDAELIALTLMSSSKTGAPELRMITIVPQLGKCLKFEAVWGVLTDQMI